MWNVRKPIQTLDELVAPALDTPRPAPVIKASADIAAVDRMIALKVKIHRMLLDRINLSQLDKIPREKIGDEVAELIGELLIVEGEALNRAERANLCDDVLDELLELLQDDEDWQVLPL